MGVYVTYRILFHSDTILSICAIVELDKIRSQTMRFVHLGCYCTCQLVLLPADAVAPKLEAVLREIKGGCLITADFYTLVGKATEKSNYLSLPSIEDNSFGPEKCGERVQNNRVHRTKLSGTHAMARLDGVDRTLPSCDYACPSLWKGNEGSHDIPVTEKRC